MKNTKLCKQKHNKFTIFQNQGGGANAPPAPPQMTSLHFTHIREQRQSEKLFHMVAAGDVKTWQPIVVSVYILVYLELVGDVDLKKEVYKQNMLPCQLT